MLPNFLIIGAPRCGTTWMAKNLRYHPDIYMPAKKELHFFNRFYDEGMAYYEKFFEEAGEEKAVGEATPAYMWTPGMAERIYNELGPVKLILSLRNPVERLYSRFLNAKSKYAENKDLSFEEKIEQKPSFIEEGHYYKHIQNFLQFFPRENMLVMFQEDLGKVGAQAFISEVFSFLEVEADFTPPDLEFKINSASSKPNVGKSKLLYESFRVLKRVGAKKLAYKVEEANSVKTEMKPETRDWLVNEVYKEENIKLGEFVNRDLSHWNV